MSSKLKVAVLGVGSLGKEHARIYAEMAALGQVDFVGVFDTSTAQAQMVAEQRRVPVFA
jgi:predicted dehydrogenase